MKYLSNKSFLSLLPKCDARALRASAYLLAAAFSAPGMAADEYNSDRPGGADHPLLSRYQGSILYMYGEESLGAGQIVVEEKGKPVLRQVEGRISNRLYLAPNGRTPLEIFRNYQQAVAMAGFQLIYACEASKCQADSMKSQVVGISRAAVWKSDDSFASDPLTSGYDRRFHFLSARKVGAGGTTYVSVALESGHNAKPMDGRVKQFIQIIEPAQVDLGKVIVNVNGIQGGLKRDGKISLYGVMFDANKAVLSKQSDAQLVEMANALKAAPDLKVFIVGHTDSQGDFQSNTVLSQQRAEAVVNVLASRYGIAQARLVGRGVANLAPVASNESEQGRAQNRRVEMVVR